MYKKTVNVSKTKGPVTVDIRGKNATAGNFAFAIETDTGYDEIFNGKFGDYIPDIFLLPYKVDDLSKYDLYMIGNFAPGSPSSHTISFDINFFQNGDVIDTASLQETNSGVLVIQYSIKFNVGA